MGGRSHNYQTKPLAPALRALARRNTGIFLVAAALHWRGGAGLEAATSQEPSATSTEFLCKRLLSGR
jgi:hypothetical protein